jgi:hypothetical protein
VRRRLWLPVALAAFGVLAWSASKPAAGPTRALRPAERREVIAALTAQVAEWSSDKALRGRDIVALPICVSTADERYVSVMLWLARPIGQPRRVYLVRSDSGYRTLTFVDGDLLSRRPPVLPARVWHGLHRKACESESIDAVNEAAARHTAPVFHTSGL